jgi:hypothetical protein
MEHISVYTEKKARQLGRGPRFVRWAVMLGIVILLNIVFVVARGVILQAPQFDTFCPASLMLSTTQTEASIIANEKCNSQYQAAESNYATQSFIFLVVLGVLALIVGILPLGSSIVSSGLSYGGVLAFIVASVAYWNDAPQITQLGISLVALGALIYIGFNSFRD